MRRLLGAASIFGFLLAFVIFVLMDPIFQLLFVAAIFIFTLFIVSFYGLTLIEERKMKRSNRFPTLSVIIPSYNSAATMEECIRHVLAMEYPRKFEVMVVDDGSTDSTAQIAKKYPVKLVQREKNKGKAASLNEAIAKAKSELIACCDSDTYPPKDLLMRSVPYMDDEKTGAMTFFITVHKPKTIWQKMQEMEYLFSFGAFPYLAARFNSILVTPGPLTIYRKQALSKIGGFDEDNITEDFEMGLKLHRHGCRILYLPIGIPTEVPKTFPSLMRQRVRWYRGTIYNILLYKDFAFNPKYSDVGYFAFPVIAAYVPITVASFFFVLARTARMIYESGLQASQFFAYSQSPVFTFDIFYIKADMVLFASFFLFYIFFLWISLSIIGEKMSFGKLKGILMVLFVYPFVNAGFYAYSLYKEISGSELQW
jgi:cellulose synthase/poly-beta-1,6-N-acetylglucosamine synthase-like glycosyltransferase